MTVTHSPALAVVVPFFNEAGNVEGVCAELQRALNGLQPFEVTAIDDGSSDETGRILDRLALSWPELSVYHLQENQGQSAALIFGFSKTSAPIIVTMDGDGQNDPRDIPRLLASLTTSDMVVGVRVSRRDAWARRKISRIANHFRSRLLGDGVSDSGCGLKVFRREVTTAFIPIKTLYSFMPALAVAAGFRVVEEPVNHRPRRHGASRYTTASFLVLPVIDFIGLKWFTLRRCRGHIRQALSPVDARRRLRALLYRHGFRRWAATVAPLIAVGMFGAVATGARPGYLPHVAERRIGLRRAEAIALRRMPAGEVSTAQLLREGSRVIWRIDVQPPQATALAEIDIDATTGQVIAARSESPQEEEMELAAGAHILNTAPGP